MPVDALRPAVHALMDRAKADLAELVAFRSVADAKQYPPEECEKAAQWVVDAFAEVGLQDVTMSPTPDGSHCVHGYAPGPEGSPTVLLYCHYDVQPPLGEDLWTAPIWELTERDGRWYGRGSADCKGNIVMHLTALRALRQANGGGFPCGVKLICEGSEEQGTGGLEEFVPPNADLLQRGHDPRRRHRQLRGRRAHADDHAARDDERRRQAHRARQRDALRHVRRAGARCPARPDPGARDAARRARQHDRRRARRDPDVDRRRLLGRAVPRGRQRARRRRADGRRHARRPAVGAAVGDGDRDRRPARDRLVRGGPGVGRRARQPAAPAGRHRPGGPGRARRAPASRACRGACTARSSASRWATRSSARSTAPPSSR